MTTFEENPLKAIYEELLGLRAELKELKESKPSEESEQGGIELAKQITGYSAATIRRKVSKGELPVISPKYATLRFDKQQLLDSMKANARPTKDQLKAKIDTEYATLKRVRRPKE